MTAQKIESIRIQKLPEDIVEEPKLSARDWMKVLSQLVTVGGDFAK